MSYQNKSIAAVTLAIMVGVLAGCSATPVSQQGARVEITTERPNGCKMLGEVVGSQGNVFSGDFTTDRALMEGARNDLRNKTAAMGGNVVQIQHSLNSTHPYSAGAVKSTLIGVAFACAGR